MLNPTHLSEIHAEINRVLAAKEKLSIMRLDKGLYATVEVSYNPPDRKIVITLDGSKVTKVLEGDTHGRM